MDLTNVTYYDDESLRRLIKQSYDIVEKWSEGENYRSSPVPYSKLKIVVSYTDAERETFAGLKGNWWSSSHNGKVHITMKRKTKAFESDLERLAASKNGDLPQRISHDFMAVVCEALMGGPTPYYEADEIAAVTPIKVHPKAKSGSASCWATLSSLASFTARRGKVAGLQAEIKDLSGKLEHYQDLTDKAQRRWGDVQGVIAKEEGISRDEAYAKMLNIAKKAGYLEEG